MFRALASIRSQVLSASHLPAQFSIRFEIRSSARSPLFRPTAIVSSGLAEVGKRLGESIPQFVCSDSRHGGLPRGSSSRSRRYGSHEHFSTSRPRGSQSILDEYRRRYCRRLVESTASATAAPFSAGEPRLNTKRRCRWYVGDLTARHAAPAREGGKMVSEGKRWNDVDRHKEPPGFRMLRQGEPSRAVSPPSLPLRSILLKRERKRAGWKTRETGHFSSMTNPSRVFHDLTNKPCYSSNRLWNVGAIRSLSYNVRSVVSRNLFTDVAIRSWKTNSFVERLLLNCVPTRRNFRKLVITCRLIRAWTMEASRNDI